MTPPTESASPRSSQALARAAIAGEAVDDPARGGDAFLSEDAFAGLVRLTDVDDDRFTGGAGDGRANAESWPPAPAAASGRSGSRARSPPPPPPANRRPAARASSQSVSGTRPQSCGWTPTVAAKSAGSAAASSSASPKLPGARQSPMRTMRSTPAARARAMTSARSCPKESPSRWAWESITSLHPCAGGDALAHRDELQGRRLARREQHSL